MKALLHKPMTLTPDAANALHGVYIALAAALIGVCQAVLHATVASGIPQVTWQELVGAAVLGASSAALAYLHTLLPAPPAT